MRTTIIETDLTFANSGSRLSASEVECLIIHHTGGSAGDDYSAAEIHQMHLNQGWAGIGYHYVIRKDGSIERGRPRTVQGAHCPGYNWRSLGLHVGGNFEEEEPAAAQVDSLTLLLADLCETYGLDVTAETIVGHRDKLATACPGKNLYAKLPEIINNVLEECKNG